MAFCRFCGNEIPDGATFCPHCGRSLMPQADAGQGQQASQGNGNYQQPGQQANQWNGNYQQPGQPNFNNYGNVMSSVFTSCRNYFVRMMTAPMTAMDEALASREILPMSILFILQLVLVFLTLLIHLPTGGILSALDAYINAGIKASCGLVGVLIMGVILLITAAVNFAFARKSNPGITFPAVFGLYCVATVPVTLLWLAAFLFGFIDLRFAIFFVILIAFLWTILTCFIICKTMAADSENRRFWICALDVAVNILIFFIICSIVVSAIVSAAAGAMGGLLGSYGSGLSNLF